MKLSSQVCRTGHLFICFFLSCSFVSRHLSFYPKPHPLRLVGKSTSAILHCPPHHIRGLLQGSAKVLGSRSSEAVSRMGETSCCQVETGLPPPNTHTLPSPGLSSSPRLCPAPPAQQKLGPPPLLRDSTAFSLLFQHREHLRVSEKRPHLSSGSCRAPPHNLSCPLTAPPPLPRSFSTDWAFGYQS